jgi:Mg2+/Co2+ transporter CorC
VLTSILTVCRVGQLLLFVSNSPKSFFIGSFESGLLLSPLIRKRMCARGQRRGREQDQPLSACLTVLAADNPAPRRWIRPLAEIRATATLQTALATLRSSGSHLARLIEDTGQTQAVIALEDILEELVGEVMDATRRPDVT